jgi:hypothetical protein
MDPIMIYMLGLACFLLIAIASAGVLLVVLVLRRNGRPTVGRTDQPPYSTPLDRAKAAALDLTPAEWEQFRRWVEAPRTPPAVRGEGIRQ